MNIALFSDTYPPEINGVATSTFNLRKTLVAHGHNVIVVTTNPFSKHVTFQEGILRIPGIKLKALYGYMASMFYNKKAMSILKDFHPEVVHCQTDAGIGIFGGLVASKFHIGSVYTFHTMIEDYTYYVTKGHFDRFARHAVRFYFRGKSNSYTEFIAPSDKIKDYLRSIGIDTTVSVIPTGVEFSRFDPINENKEETLSLKNKYDIKEDEYVLLSLGRIAKEKSIDVVIKGFANFKKQYPYEKVKLVITGWGPAEKELQDLSYSLGINDSVVFTGKCDPDQTQKYYHLGDCFASASITETQGLTFMEAMAGHLIVMARYDDNLVGTIKDGETGFFFKDEMDFPNKLKLIMDLKENEKNKIIQSSLKAIDIYSMEHFYNSIIEVYERVRRKSW
ncbi:MAG TPA: hypothetical protein DEF61_04565 [Firmicutes bacterium]|nr:hypothetical protein [Bacillota bacterium]HBX25503.1 hypothetical protein [Bacillota bacterium]